jgi:hypothetical protein
MRLIALLFMAGTTVSVNGLILFGLSTAFLNRILQPAWIGLGFKG